VLDYILTLLRFMYVGHLAPLILYVGHVALPKASLLFPRLPFTTTNLRLTDRLD
jgi:hypothetical protein